MMRQIFGSVIVSAAISLIGSTITRAQSLEIRPTIYQNIRLEKGERKKAFVDVHNRSTTTQVINMKVRAFRQVDDSGALKFYDDERLTSGIILDLHEFELRGGEVIRIYFMMDGAKLPEGDVFASIFAQTFPPNEPVAQSVQVGSLLTIINGTPTPHTADVTLLQATPLQIGESVTARFSLTNPADEHQATGFFPSVTVRMWPYGERVVKGPLLFAGRTRTIEYREPGNYVGPIRFEVDAGGEKATQLLFVVTGFWRWLLPLLIAGGVVIFLTARRLNIALRNRH